MNDQAILNKVRNATLWSTVTQLTTKLFSPLSNIILARLLSPETFGIVATVMIIISFTDIFIDTGFPKYLIQHEFHSLAEEKVYANVAFWTNIAVAFFLWVFIIIFRHPIATMVGNSSLDYVIAIACMQLPINALSSVQSALYTRSFKYRDIFIIRVISALIPFFVTIPLAYLGLRHWSIIIGSTSSIIFSTTLLTIKSDWRPFLFYRFKILKEMLSFSSWSILEGFFLWLITWVDIIVIGNVFSDYYLGLYITSYNMVNALMSMITSAIAPVLFAALSRMQNDKILFYFTYLKYQKMIAYFLLPIGIGIFLYRGIATNIILGKNWMEASNIIGIFALTTAIQISLVNLNSEALKAIGQPKISLILQVLDLGIIVPICIMSKEYGFWSLVYARSFARFNLIIPSLLLVSIIFKYRIWILIKNISLPFLCTIVMSLLAIVLRQLYTSKVGQIISIAICAIFYLLTIILCDKNVLYKFYVFYNKRRYK